MWTWMCHLLFHQCLLMTCLFHLFFAFFSCHRQILKMAYCIFPENNVFTHPGTVTLVWKYCNFNIWFLSVRCWVCFTRRLKYNQLEKDVPGAQRPMIKKLLLPRSMSPLVHKVTDTERWAHWEEKLHYYGPAPWLWWLQLPTVLALQWCIQCPRHESWDNMISTIHNINHFIDVQLGRQ